MRKSQKTIFIFLILIIFNLVACNKEEGTMEPLPSSFFIEANFNGQLIRHEISTLGIIDQNYFSGIALEAAAPNSPTFSFTVEGMAEVVEKTYREVDNETIMIFTYSISGLEHYHSQMGDENDFIITITKIGDTYFTGAFSGTLRYINEPYEILNVSNGKFVLPIQ